MRFVAVIVTTLAVVLLTAAKSGEQAGGIVRSEVSGQSTALLMPTGEAEPKGLAVWFHGQGGGVDVLLYSPFLDGLRRDGWAIAASDFHQQSWGNTFSTNDTRLLTQWAESLVGLPTSLWISGSMGGTVSLNAMTHGVPAPPCWYGVKPAISLTQMDNVPGGNRFIKAAYNNQPVPADRDPINNIERLPIDTRYRVSASQEDQSVRYEENSGPLMDGLDARGAEVTAFEASGEHMDPSHFNTADLISFADTCVPR